VRTPTSAKPLAAERMGEFPIDYETSVASCVPTKNKVRAAIGGDGKKS
jgi:hypothetical protein